MFEDILMKALFFCGSVCAFMIVAVGPLLLLYCKFSGYYERYAKIYLAKKKREKRNEKRKWLKERRKNKEN